VRGYLEEMSEDPEWGNAEGRKTYLDNMSIFNPYSSAFLSSSSGVST
jgi:hypothetical protein